MKRPWSFMLATLMATTILAMGGCGDEGSDNGGFDPTNGDIVGGVELQAGAIKLPKTGQTHRYAPDDDGTLQVGVAWPEPRFSDDGNGTVTDNLTGLVWLKNANCKGQLSWYEALDMANTLASGTCGLNDGSAAGQWRLPNIVELESLVNLSQYDPALPVGHPFTGVRSFYYINPNSPLFTTYSYWTSTFMGWGVSDNDASGVGVICMCFGEIKTSLMWPNFRFNVWPVRDKIVP